MSVLYNCCQFVFLSVVVFFLIAYSPTFVDVEPRQLSPVKARQLEGALSWNNKLSKVVKKFEGLILGPESFIVYKGKIYSGLADGRIIAIDGEKCVNISEPEKQCLGPWDQHLCGRPLGLRISSDGVIYAVDPYKGLFTTDIKTGERIILVKANTLVDGKPLRFLDDLVIDEKENVIYMTDASTKWNFKQLMYIGIEGLPTGRVIKYDMKTEALTVIAEGFLFSNGIQLSHDRKSLLISDTHMSRINRYHLSGPDKGKLDVFVEGLPGYPDNIRSNQRGGYWVAMAVFQDPNSPRLFDSKVPLIVKKVILRVMDKVTASINFISHHLIRSLKWKNFAYMLSSHAYVVKYPNYGLIVELDKDGNIIDSLHAPNGEIMHISEVLEHDGNLYFGSFVNNYLGFLERK